jgi:drug/metabolite transporter (DMT)-like permease
MIFMTLVPPMAALLGWAIMRETLTRNHIAGMALTLAGTLIVVLDKRGDANRGNAGRPMLGVLLALGAAVGQAVGLVLSKYGMGAYSAFAATQIRAIAAVAGFALIFMALGAWRKIADGLRDTRAMWPTLTGAVFGPFLGVSCSLLSVQYTETGIASTIMATVPVLIIPPAVILFKEKVTLRQALGAAVAVAGVAVLFM